MICRSSRIRSFVALIALLAPGIVLLGTGCASERGDDAPETTGSRHPVEEGHDSKDDASAVAAETPTQALAAILALHESGDYDQLVRTRYAELWKAEEEAQVEALVARLRDHFAKPERRDELVSAYEAAMAVDPEMEQDDRVAVFRIQAGSIRLSRMSSGRWGFHL